jgi:photosystem II stability/assembly factor-like uncharacterized protein
MKSIITVILLFIVLAIPGNAQWKKVTSIPAPYGDSYYLDVYFLESNPLYGWACGKNGVTIRTIDGGKTWAVTVIPYAYQLESIHFVNERVGYTSGLVSNGTGYGGCFKSTDGGKTWNNVSPPGQIDAWGTFFLDENTGLTIGGGCGPGKQQQFYRTTNGGRNWIGFYGNRFDTGLTDLFIDSFTGRGFASSSGEIWATSDFGKTWRHFVTTGTSDWQEEITLNGNTFLLPYSTGCEGGGGTGGARISTDYGMTWRDKNLGNSMFGAFLHNELTGWIVGWGRSCFFTSDAGKTWANRNCGIPIGIDLDDIWFINDTLGFVVGQGIYKYIGDLKSKVEIQASTSFPACSGDTVVLFSKSEFDYYKWSTGETTSSIKVTKPGTYTLWAAHNECDSSTSKPIIASFYPKSSLTLKLSDTTGLCEGDTVSLSVLEKFKSYKWSNGDTNSSTTIYKSGKYSVMAIDSNGCVISDSVTIKFAPLPEAIIDVSGKTDFCIGDSVLLTSRKIYPKYQWFKDADLTSFSNDRSVLIKESGTYKLMVMNEFGCISVSDLAKVNVRLDTNLFDFTMSIVSEFSLDSVNYPNIVCKKIKLRSKSWKQQTIDNIYFYKNLSFSIPQSYLPIVLPPFGEFEFEICYSPRKMDWERDTMFVNDRCSPHILPLIARGIPNKYESDSKCDVPLEFNTTGIYGFDDILTGPPFPNPTGGIVNVPLKVIFEENEPEFEIYLTDAFQNARLHPTIEFLSQSEIENDMIESKNLTVKNMKAVFDVSNLPNGIYFIIVKSSTSKVYKIIINK